MSFPVLAGPLLKIFSAPGGDSRYVPGIVEPGKTLFLSKSGRHMALFDAVQAVPTARDACEIVWLKRTENVGFAKKHSFIAGKL